MPVQIPTPLRLSLKVWKIIRTGEEEEHRGKRREEERGRRSRCGHNKKINFFDQKFRTKTHIVTVENEHTYPRSAWFCSVCVDRHKARVQRETPSIIKNDTF